MRGQLSLKDAKQIEKVATAVPAVVRLKMKAKFVRLVFINQNPLKLGNGGKVSIR